MEEKASRLPFAMAGLLATVAAAWISLLLRGGLGGDWLLAGVLALGCGVLVVNLLARVAPALFEGQVVDAEDAPPIHGSEPAPEQEDAPPNPRLRVLIVSSCLEALAVALMTSYLVGDVVVAVGAGAAMGVLAIGVSVLLARAMASPA